MAPGTTFLFFRDGDGDLKRAADILAASGCIVRLCSTASGEHLGVTRRNSPELQVYFVRDPYVREEAAETGRGTPYERQLAECDVRFAISCTDLDAVLDESDALCHVQDTLRHATGAYLYNDWNGGFAAPHE